ncbi:MAG TPA: L,D-transpeptidase family protein [Anaerolineales bacterium]
MKKQPKKNNTRLFLFLGAMSVLGCAVLGIAAWTAVNHPAFASIVNNSPVPTQESLWAQVEIAKPPLTPIDVSAFAPQAADTPVPTTVSSPIPAVESTPVPTNEPTSVPTEAPTFTPEATETPAQLSMEIVPNTPTSVYVPPTNSAGKPVYASSGNGARWIDVDLTNQRVYAYEGDTIVNSFIVSTGTWQTPTVTGQFKIYVKFRSAKMSGPGYYLPNVPYIMYFYGDYGLHGTYWHNNFGTPMSRGCVNLTIDDAGWLYNWASVGTVVNVHY